MILKEPNLILEKMGDREWRFKQSDFAQHADIQFEELLSKHLGRPSFGGAVRAFMLTHPYCSEAFRYYSLLKIDHQKPTDALVFAHTAVAIGRAAFTHEFITERGILPTGWTSNRPYLRALHGLMLAQEFSILRDEAISTGEECLRLDPEDRTGARLKLVEYYIRAHRPKAALMLFEKEIYKDSFWADGYLHALALFELRGADGARNILQSYLSYYPHVARYILDAGAEMPANDSVLGGLISGSPHEGWVKANTWGWLWRNSPTAMAFLKEEADSCEKNNRARG